MSNPNGDLTSIGREKRVFLVEDDPDFAALFVNALKKSEFEVTVAGSAEEALEIQKEYFWSMQFIDLQLPGMNGLELCRQIREDDAISLLVAITAHRNMFQLIDAREAGFDDLYYKPIRSAEILDAVKQNSTRIERWERF